VGLVEKVDGDGNWRMIRHLSKIDNLGFSTNDTLNSDNFPTAYFSASHVAEWVSPYFWVFVKCSMVCDGDRMCLSMFDSVLAFVVVHHVFIVVCWTPISVRAHQYSLRSLVVGVHCMSFGVASS